MKHMWSEEEIQEQAKIENLVDSKGRNRFIEIEGTPGENDGMQIYYGKCDINGNNLIFEIEGVFTKSIIGDFILCKFALPEWIAQKIHLAFAYIVDIIEYNLISTEASIGKSTYAIFKEGNELIFNQADNIDVVGGTNKVFRIRYNLIIDND